MTVNRGNYHLLRFAQVHKFYPSANEAQGQASFSVTAVTMAMHPSCAETAERPRPSAGRSHIPQLLARDRQPRAEKREI
jgi:hypothetical protein